MDTGLAQAVRKAIGVESLDRIDAARTAVDYDPFLPGRAVARLAGSASIGDRTERWSMIEKITDPAPVAPPFLRDGGHRELMAYRSGLLEDLGGAISAPRAYLASEDETGRIRLLLEEVADERPGDWMADDWVRAARHLGRFAARWIGEPVPAESWLLHRWSDRHAQPEGIPLGRAIFDEAAGHPEVVALLGPEIAMEGHRLVDELPQRLATLAEVPTVLCHHDAVRANLFVRRHGDALDTVAIDWEAVGPGPVAADLVSLLFSSVRRGDLSTGLLLQVAPAVLEAYAAEIRPIDAAAADAVAVAFASGVCLRWSLLRDVVRALGMPGGTLARGRRLDEPIEETVDELVGLTRFLLATAAGLRDRRVRHDDAVR
jgi:Phosphotransferase enzyme family